MGRFKISFNEKWEYNYNGHKIVVVNGLSGCSLNVDGKMQDSHNGVALAATLTGKVDNKPIKVSIGGFWKINCDVFVDHEHIALVRKSEF